MPTKRPRHTITETPPVERALRRLRTLEPGVPTDFKELVILGAQTKAARLERGERGAGEQRRALVEELLGLRADDRLDVATGLALHDSAWVRDG